VAVKAALKQMGLDMGPPRRPLKAVGGALLHETRAEIRLELEKLGKIQPSDEMLAFPAGSVAKRFSDLEITPALISAQGLRCGSGRAGVGLSEVQVDLIAGGIDTALGDAYALQLTYPLHGREALTAILEPGLMVRPPTLLLPGLPQRDLRQANMIYGPSQAALGRAIVDALEQGLIPIGVAESDVMVAITTVHPRALDRHELFGSVHAATTQAIANAFRQGDVDGPQA